jgi:hypothetical protein
MRNRWTYAAVGLLIAVGAVVVFWRFVVSAGIVYGCWRVYRHHYPSRRRVHRGRTVLELVAAGLAGWWASRKAEDVVARAVRGGGSVSVIVNPSSRKPLPPRRAL